MEWKDPPADVSGHVVVCNGSPLAGQVIEEIQGARPVDVVLVIASREEWQANPHWHPRTSQGAIYVIEGRPTDESVLQRARVRHARAAVILADPAHGDLADARSALVAIAIEQEAPAAHTIMELLSSVNRVHLEATEVNEVICIGEITEKLIAQSCVTPGVRNIFWRLLTTASGTEQMTVMPLPPELAGTTYRQLARRAVLAGAPYLLCGFVRAAQDEPKAGQRRQKLPGLVLNPRPGADPGRDTRLQPGDALVLLCRRVPSLAELGEQPPEP